MKQELIIIFVFCIVVSGIWFAIHFHLKQKQKKGKYLSKRDIEWLQVSKFAGFLFLILSVIIYPILWVGDMVWKILLGFPCVLALLSMMRKK